jgi:hypothetical protein
MSVPPKNNFNDKDLETIKDRAILEWKQINGENAVVRAYITSVCIWLRENGLLTEENIPNYKPRDLAINSRVED